MGNSRILDIESDIYVFGTPTVQLCFSYATGVVRSRKKKIRTMKVLREKSCFGEDVHGEEEQRRLSEFSHFCYGCRCLPTSIAQKGKRDLPQHRPSDA
jgi:hypothetical protein